MKNVKQTGALLYILDVGYHLREWSTLTMHAYWSFPDQLALPYNTIGYFKNWISQKLLGGAMRYPFGSKVKFSCSPSQPLRYPFGTQKKCPPGPSLDAFLICVVCFRGLSPPRDIHLGHNTHVENGPPPPHETSIWEKKRMQKSKPTNL
jgi:hypothetical protein